MFFGPPTVGGLIANYNWAIGMLPMAIAVVIGMAASWLLARRAWPSAAIIETQL